jgi:cysteine desulfurase
MPADLGTLAYLDHAATAPVRAEVVAAMEPFFGTRFGNPSGSHPLARDARRAVDEAREQVAEDLGCRPSEVVFTSGGTESDNAAILGAVRRHGGTAVCPATEHHAVLHPVEHVGGRVVDVLADGTVDLDHLASVLDENTRVVSVMLANNETGTVQPLAAVAEVVAERAPQAWLHTDAVQGACWFDVADVAAPAHLVSLSGHKLGGPKGVGVLVVRKDVVLEPLLLGGGQEHERRSGTHNVAGIVGFAAALRATRSELAVKVPRVTALRDRLVDGLLRSVDGVVETVPRDRRIAGNAHVCIEGVESESLLYLLEKAGVCASAASACASGALDPSHVLAAMGVPKELAAGALRLSLGWSSTDADVDRVLDALPAAVIQLRRLA